MESLKILKFSKLNVKRFIDYLSDTNIKEKETIDFEQTRLVCKSHSEMKMYIKFVEVGIDKLFGEINPYKHLYFPLNDVGKLIKIFELYNSNNIETVDGDIHYYDDNEGNQVATLFNIKAGQLKNKIALGEYGNIQYLKTDIWEKTISEVEKSSIVFKLLAIDVDNLLKLLAIDKDTAFLNKTKDFNKFAVKPTSNGKISINSFEGKWEYLIEDVEIMTEKKEIYFFDITLKLLDKKDHKVSVYLSSRGLYMGYIEEIKLEETIKPKKYLVSCDIKR